MYPIKFENLYYEKIWGGRDIGKFRNNLPEGMIGESWDVACHKNGMSIVSNGEFKGKKLEELIEEQGSKLLGNKIDLKWFPLLVKIINAKGKLSVQVHPKDEYAKINENDMGKTECWYVMDSEKGATIVFGTKDCDLEKFKEAIKNDEVEKYLNRVPVKAGDFFFVKSGTVHAIEEGITIMEIQQNSDTTYRVYDYGRPRELHVKKALDVIDFNSNFASSQGINIHHNGYERTYLSLCENFCIEKLQISKRFDDESDEDRFYILSVVDGTGKIIFGDKNEKLTKGDSVLIPASLGRYSIEGNIKILKSYVPDMNKVEQEILSIIEM